MTYSTAFERIGFVVVAGTNRRIDHAASRDGLDRGEWLQQAVRDALERSERGEYAREES
jgi:hypothetical protein